MLRNAWYAAAFASEIGEHPLGREIVGRPIVLYRDRDGHAVALDRTCPHRGMDLARGRIVDGNLVCSYHGWQFDKSGRCTHIPSQPAGAKIPNRAALGVHVVRERDGIVWIWPSDSVPSRDLPEYDTGHTPAVRGARVAPRLWHAPFVHVVEQALDTSHHAFVHRPSMGRRQPTVVPEQRIEMDGDGTGFRYGSDPAMGRSATHANRTGLRSWISRVLLQLGPESERRYRFQLGGVLQVWIERDSGREIGSILMTPADAHSTWVFMEMFRTRARHPLGDAAQRLFLERVVREDESAAESLAWHEYPEGFPTSLSVSADAPGLAFRKLYERSRDAENPTTVETESRG